MNKLNNGTIVSLFDAALKCLMSTMKDLLPYYLEIMPSKVSYKLIDLSVELKKIDTFAICIQHWPLTNFDVTNLRNDLSEDHYALIFNKLRDNSVKKITKFDFVGELIWKFGHYNKVDKTFTEFLLNYILKNKQESSCSIAKSRSFQDALKHCLSVNKKLPPKEEVNVSKQNALKKTIQMHIQIVVEYQILDELMIVLRNQHNENPTVRLIISCYFFRWTNSTNICKIIQLTDKSELHGIDLGFSAMSNNQVFDVCEALGKCSQLKNLTWHYGNLKETDFHALSECISMLPKLNYLDLSMNHALFSKLKESDPIPFETLTSLILSGCGIDRSTMSAFATSCNTFQSIRLLDLSYNKALRKSKKSLVHFIQSIAAKLQYLDLMHCNIKSKTLSAICESFVESKQLSVLKLWKNDSSLEYFQDVLYPALKNQSLKEFPPII